VVPWTAVNGDPAIALQQQWRGTRKCCWPKRISDPQPVDGMYMHVIVQFLALNWPLVTGKPSVCMGDTVVLPSYHET
jgi:hypothetical protein